MTTHRAMLRKQREAMAELPGQLAAAEHAQAAIYAASKKAQRALRAEVDDLRAAIAERDERIAELEKAAIAELDDLRAAIAERDERIAELEKKIDHGKLATTKKGDA